MSNANLFPASVVGSLPRPKFVQDLILADGDPFSEIIDKAVLFAIALQEAAGLEIISDGEWRRKSYLGPVSKVAYGIADHFNGQQKKGEPWRHTVTKKLVHLAPGWFAKEAAFLKKHTAKKIKVCLPSPYLLGQRMWDEEESVQAYSARRDFMEAVVPILRKELILLKEAGADVIQIDDPHICLFVDSTVRAQYQNPAAELKLAVDLVNAVINNVTGIAIALHLCRRNKGRAGWVGEGGYEAIIDALSNLKVSQLVMEYTIPVAGDFKALAALPKNFNIGLGCVDCRFEHIDTPEEIAARVEAALAYVAPDRITLNPDCGFAPGSQRVISLDEVYQKLHNEVMAAEMLREKYST